MNSRHDKREGTECPSTLLPIYELKEGRGYYKKTVIFVLLINYE